MLIQIVIFLTCFIIFEYFQVNRRGKIYNFVTVTMGKPKPLNCEVCLTFWLVLTAGLIIDFSVISLLLAEISFISYILLKKIL